MACAVAEERREVAYGTHEAQRLDVYSPAGLKGAPIMVYVHGGAWSRGDKGAVHLKADYFTRAGWVFVSVNYRLPPAGRFPDNVKDVAAAVAWAWSHGAEYGGDRNQIFLLGHSAGCHLASLVATDGRYLLEAGLPLTAIKAVVALDTQAYDIGKVMETRAPELYEQAFGNDPETHAEASPIYHIAKGKGIPPFLVCYSRGAGQQTNPVRAQSAKAFVAALVAAEVRAEWVDASDRDHAAINRQFGDPNDEKVTVRAMAFLESIRKDLASATIEWKPSLTFSGGSPQPINAMNLTAHRGLMFCGMATSFERGRYSKASSYVYVKRSADKPWELDADFGPGTSRVGAMGSVRFVNDAAGQPIPGGPVDLLVAFTLQTGDGASPLQARVRDDANGTWQTCDLPVPLTVKPNVRVMHPHRDPATGADLLFIGASPHPLGLIRGAYDAAAPGRIRWSSPVEMIAESRRGQGKWFGMSEVNGALLASDAHRVYRRVDGAMPQWRMVSEFPVVSDEQGASVRGLTAVPNAVRVTGWEEGEQALFATRFAVWRMRVPADPAADHPRVAEIQLLPWLSQRLGDTVVFAEAAFNELRPFAGRWPIGFQVVFGVEGKTVSWDDPSTFRTKPNAWMLWRTREGAYALEEIAPRCPPEQALFLARDFLPSPFPGETNALYAAGFNGSYFKASLGTAWVYQRSIQP
jgi:acetyl esterase/lipase